MEITKEFLKKAKLTKNPEELITLAKENGVELTEEKAKTYFAKLNSKEGELADDELGDVAGGRKCGTIYKDGWPVIVAQLNSCEYYEYGKDRGYPETEDNCNSCVYRDSTGFLEVCKCPKRYEN